MTVPLAVGIALPIYGAILEDGYQAERERAEVLRLSEKRSGHRSAA